MERLCKDCRHFTEWDRVENRGHQCAALNKGQHPVWGGAVSGIDAGLVRMTLCGWSDPKWWEQKTGN